MVFKLAILLLFCPASEAAIINASSPSRVDVSNAHNACVNGDVLSIPAGSATWTDTLFVTKGITIQGAGVGSTVISDGITTYSSLLIDWTMAIGRTQRLTGIEFRDNGGFVGNVPRLQFSGVSTNTTQIRIDHCKFSSLSAGCFTFYTVLGVVDHNVIIARTGGTEGFVGYSINSSWGTNQGVTAWGDGAWAESDNFGTDKFIFFEDNYITNLYSTPLTMFDGHSGGRAVFRYNTIVGGSWEGHGAEAARTRSWRAWEIYMNTNLGIANARGSPLYVRGGNGVIWSNYFDLWTATPNFALLNGRSLDEDFAPMGGSDGRNPWDKNNAGNPFVTGTCSSAGALTMTDSGKSWTVNQWAGYTVRKTGGTTSKTVTSLTRSGPTATAVVTSHGYTTGDYISFYGANEYGYNNLWSITVVDANTFTFFLSVVGNLATTATGTIKCTAKNKFALINANTATQLTFQDSIQGSTRSCTFAAGDTYEINLVDQSMDQIGILGGTALGGADYPALPGPWNDQTVSAWYEWGNTVQGGYDIDFSNGYLGGSYAVIVSGTHFKDDTQKPGYIPYTYPHPLTLTDNSTSTPHIRGLRGF